jgi:hypothetical protein
LKKRTKKLFLIWDWGVFTRAAWCKRCVLDHPQYVMAVLDTAIHALLPMRRKAWIAGSSPAMTGFMGHGRLNQQGAELKKFFGSFFQKRTAYFLNPANLPTASSISPKLAQ